MSDQLAAAAAALDVPEALVRRSAEARAKATGASVDDILSAWAGGGTAPAAPTPAAPAAEPTPEAMPAAAEPAATAPPPEPPPPGPAAAPPVAAAVVTAPSPTIDTAPPVLTGRIERPFTVMLGAVGALLLALVAGYLAPLTPQEGNGVRSSNVALDIGAERGRDVYRSLGCAACHTQMVRSLATDDELGPVTLDDTNLEPGSHRYGPDLSAVGARITDRETYVAILSGVAEHPSYSGLSADDTADLIAYLSATAPPPEGVGS